MFLQPSPTCRNAVIDAPSAGASMIIWLFTEDILKMNSSAAEMNSAAVHAAEAEYGSNPELMISAEDGR